MHTPNLTQLWHLLPQQSPPCSTACTSHSLSSDGLLTRTIFIWLAPLQLKLAAPDITTEQVAAVRDQAATKVSQLQQLRLEREQAEVQRGEAAARLRAAEAALRDAHQQRLQQRQWALEQQALQVTARQCHIICLKVQEPTAPHI
jgi:hypothetical protein